MSKKAIAAITISLGVACASFGCAKKEASAPTKAAPSASASEDAGPPGASEVEPVREVSSSFIGESWDEKLASRVGETVGLTGKFQAADERPCTYAPRTRPRGFGRTDWVFEKDGRCIWVHNGIRIFGDPDLIVRGASIGRKVEVTAVVSARDDGLLYLDYVEGRPLPE